MALVSHKYQLLGLASAASLLELGPIAALLNLGGSITTLLAAGLAYQVGNAFPISAHTGRSTLALVATIAVVLLLVLQIATPGWFVALAVSSWALQSVRRAIAAGDDGDRPTTAQKRLARVCGFVLSTLLPMPASMLSVLALLAAAVPAMSVMRKRSPRRPLLPEHSLEWTMLIHQTHYFAYAYAVPALVARPGLGGIPFVGVWFALGWISYLSAEMLWQRFPPRPVFILGHLSLTVVLLVLSALSDAPWAAMVFWVLSGFGGGTVYCLTLLHKREGLSHVRLERAEDGGHLTGVTLAIGGVSLFGWSAGTLPAVGAVCALAAALTMIAMLRFGSKSTASHSGTQGATHARQ
ncbi:hypothetical protein [Mesorhizobium sp. M0968]|uniref:hypothetical protein n=1 Tax=Mesorhizobium sp. M0968 TaxID=2957037 RepID=UPI00333A16DF